MALPNARGLRALAQDEQPRKGTPPVPPKGARAGDEPDGDEELEEEGEAAPGDEEAPVPTEESALRSFTDDITTAAEQLGSGIEDENADFDEFERAILGQLDAMDDGLLIALDEMQGVTWDEAQAEGMKLDADAGGLLGAWIFWAALAISEDEEADGDAEDTDPLADESGELEPLDEAPDGAVAPPDDDEEV